MLGIYTSVSGFVQVCQRSYLLHGLTHSWVKPSRNLDVPHTASELCDIDAFNVSIEQYKAQHPIPSTQYFEHYRYQYPIPTQPARCATWIKSHLQANTNLSESTESTKWCSYESNGWVTSHTFHRIQVSQLCLLLSFSVLPAIFQVNLG